MFESLIFKGNKVTPEDVWQEIKVHDLAKKIGISAKSIYAWKKRKNGIPPLRAIEVEKITGINRAKLRPDLWD